MYFNLFYDIIQGNNDTISDKNNTMTVIHQINDGVKLYRNDKIAFPPHLHEEVEIIFIFKGNALANINGEEFILGEGDIAIIFPDAVHGYKQLSDKVEVGKFIFQPDFLPEIKNELYSGAPIRPVIRRNEWENMRLTPLAQEILAYYENSSAAVKKAYLLLLTGKILSSPTLFEKSKAHPRKTDTVTQIIDYCKDNYREDITVKSIAKELFISEGYVSRIFADKLKINFRAYINGLRLNRALKLLNETNLSVSEIAYDCGFSCMRTFNRVFYARFGVSPSKY